MLERVKEWIHCHGLINREEKVLAACSGGPDSLALVHILRRLRSEYNISLAVAHVNHMLRGTESDEDARFVAEYCQSAGLDCYQTAIPVARLAAASGRSVEDAGRIARYQFLRQVAADLGGAVIATGHHRDDQAETVLIHLLRGAGSAGIRGMLPKNNGIIRPLLPISRAEIAAYCREQGLEPRVDSSNEHTDYLRNRIRIQLLPELAEQYNPAVKESLCRTAAIVGDEHDYIRAQAEKVWPLLASRQDGGWLIDGQQVNELHIALQREIFRLAIEKKQGCLTGISFYHVERLIEMVRHAFVGSRLELPGGLIARKDYSGLWLGTPLPPGPWAGIRPPGIPLVIPGYTDIPQIGCQVKAKICTEKAEEKGRQVAVFDWQALAPPLYVRTRLPGDRFSPLGLGGSKKVKDFLIDAKVPRKIRDRVPIICDGRGILWLGGYRQDERGKISDQTTDYLQLMINRVIVKEQEDD
ncbi:MAG: tRNA lysidine(34) synthetase TilS [Veillonellales bacterium]